MDHIVSITSQGQLTIPKALRRQLDIKGAVKAVVKLENGKLIVEPKSDFWNLEGSLQTDIVASDDQIKSARDKFEKEWAKDG
jgi:AbrB family looped-hinge helix DNA binding protein